MDFIDIVWTFSDVLSNVILENIRELVIDHFRVERGKNDVPFKGPSTTTQAGVLIRLDHDDQALYYVIVDLSTYVWYESQLILSEAVRYTFGSRRYSIMVIYLIAK